MRWAADLTDTRTKAQYYPNLGKDQLVGEYIAEKSGHSRGSTLDLTLAEKDVNGNWRIDGLLALQDTSAAPVSSMPTDISP